MIKEIDKKWFEAMSIYAIFKYGSDKDKEDLKKELGEEKYNNYYNKWRGKFNLVKDE